MAKKSPPPKGTKAKGASKKHVPPAPEVQATLFTAPPEAPTPAPPVVPVTEPTPAPPAPPVLDPNKDEHNPDPDTWPKVADKGLVVKKGEPDPKLIAEFANVTHTPAGDWRCNCAPAEIPQVYGPRWRQKYDVGMPRAGRVATQHALREQGMVGLYFKPR